LFHRPGEKFVKRDDTRESTRAFEGFEKMTRLNIGEALVGMKLEELLAGSRTAQTSQDAKLAVTDIGNPAQEYRRGDRE
jgi:hypothetical protein